MLCTCLYINYCASVRLSEYVIMMRADWRPLPSGHIYPLDTVSMLDSILYVHASAMFQSHYTYYMIKVHVHMFSDANIVT